MPLAQEEEDAGRGEGGGDVADFGEVGGLGRATYRGTLPSEAVEESNVLTAYIKRSDDRDGC